MVSCASTTWMAIKSGAQRHQAAVRRRLRRKKPRKNKMSEELPREEHIRTNFLENQARDADRPLFSQTPMKIILALVVAGVAFGIYQAVMFFINMDHNNAMKNVD